MSELVVNGRLRTSPMVLLFHGRWKLDLYYQLRSQEISGRVEKVCQLLSSPGEKSKDSIDDIYNSSMLTIDMKEVLHLQAVLNVNKFNTTAIKVVLIEMATCLHTTVMLQCQAAKFFGLAVQLLLKLQNTVNSMLSTPSNLTEQPTVGATPNKQTEKAVVSYTSEDLSLLASDLESLSHWIESFFINFCENALPYKRLPPVAIPTPPYYTTSPVSRLLTSQSNGLKQLLFIVWNKIILQLSFECKTALHAVKAVAGKYRMTNKPAPDVASTYVKTILQPVKVFLEKKSKSIPSLIPSTWVCDCIELVTSSYLQHVKELMETAKQMDTALQRRSKLRSTNTVGDDKSTESAKKNALGDSEKISLQILLDVLAYGDELRCLNIDPDVSTAYKGLLEEVAEARLIVTK